MYIHYVYIYINNYYHLFFLDSHCQVNLGGSLSVFDSVPRCNTPWVAVAPTVVFSATFRGDLDDRFFFLFWMVGWLVNSG